MRLSPGDCCKHEAGIYVSSDSPFFTGRSARSPLASRCSRFSCGYARKHEPARFVDTRPSNETFRRTRRSPLLEGVSRRANLPPRRRDAEIGPTWLFLLGLKMKVESRGKTRKEEGVGGVEKKRQKPFDLGLNLHASHFLIPCVVYILAFTMETN